MKMKLSVMLLLLMVWQSTCLASLYYVGKDDEGTSVYFSPESIEVLADKEDKFIFTVYVKEILSMEARNHMKFSRYNNELCYPYHANMATVT